MKNRINCMPRRHALLVFLFFSLFYVLTNSFRHTVQMPDEEYVLRVAASLVNGTPVYLPDDLPHYKGATDVGKNGKVYSSYQIGQSIVYAPFYFLINRLLAFSEPFDPLRFEGGRAEYETWLERETRSYLYLCPALFAALSCAVFFLFAWRLGFSSSTLLLLTLFYGLSTMVWPYSKYLLSEATLNALSLLSVYLLYAQRQDGKLKPKAMILSGAVFGLLLSIRAIYVIFLPILAFYWFFKNQERRFIAPLVAFLVPATLLFVPQLVYDHIRFGSLFSMGYSQGKFSTPLYVGIYGFLFSSGKSFFLYNPVCLLFFPGIFFFFKRARTETYLILSMLVIVPLKFAGWWVWSGDPCWGPRYLLILIPFTLFPVGELLERVVQDKILLRRAFLGFVFILSTGVQVLAVSVHYLYYLNYVHQSSSFIARARYEVAAKTNGALIPMRDHFLETEFIPEYSPILGHLWILKSLVSDNQNIASSAPWAGLGFSQIHENFPVRAEWDLWIVNLILKGLKVSNVRIILAAVTLILVLSIVGQELFHSIFVRQKGD